MRLDQYPDKFTRNGSGLPVPSNGRSRRFLDELIDFLEQLAILLLEPKIIAPSR